MPDDVIIHAGLHKTATSFLQRHVFPECKTWTLVTRPFTQHNRALNKLQYADDSLFEIEEARSALKEVGGSRLLLSDESFSGKPVLFGYVNRTMIARRFKELFPRATVLLFLRGQESIIRSHYNQYVKKGGVKSIGDFLWRSSGDYAGNDNPSGRKELSQVYFNTSDFYLHPDCFLYNELVSTYYRFFDRVEVLLYEDLVHRPAAVLDRLQGVLGEEFSKGAIERILTTRRVNESVDNLGRLRVRNRLSPVIGDKSAGFLARLVRRDRSAEDGKWLRAFTESYYKANNAKVAEGFPEIGLTRYTEHYAL